MLAFSGTVSRVAIAGLFSVAATTASTSWREPDAPNRLVGSVDVHVVQKGETLRSIGSRLAIDPWVIAAENGRRPGVSLKAGEQLRLDNRHLAPAQLQDHTITINIPQRMLFYRSYDEMTAVPVAVGSAGWPTPVASFTAVAKEENPTWDVPRSIQEEARIRGKPLPAQVPPGRDNPLGRFWIGTSIGSVGIHGTNAPTSLYRAVTHGCIRVHPDDIERLFVMVVVGTPGELVYQPVLLSLEGADVYLEVHTDVYRRSAKRAIDIARQLAITSGTYDRVDWQAAETVASAREGIARVVTRR